MPILDPDRGATLDEKTFLETPNIPGTGELGYWEEAATRPAGTANLSTGGGRPLKEAFGKVTEHLLSLMPPVDAAEREDGLQPNPMPTATGFLGKKTYAVDQTEPATPGTFMTPSLQGYLMKGLSSVVQRVQAIVEEHPPKFRQGLGGGPENTSPDNAISTTPGGDREWFFTDSSA